MCTTMVYVCGRGGLPTRGEGGGKGGEECTCTTHHTPHAPHTTTSHTTCTAHYTPHTTCTAPHTTHHTSVHRHPILLTYLPHLSPSCTLYHPIFLPRLPLPTPMHPLRCTCPPYTHMHPPSALRLTPPPHPPTPLQHALPPPASCPLAPPPHTHLHVLNHRDRCLVLRVRVHLRLLTLTAGDTRHECAAHVLK